MQVITPIWSPQQLASEVWKQSLIDAIEVSTLGRIRKKTPEAVEYINPTTLDRSNRLVVVIDNVLYVVARLVVDTFLSDRGLLRTKILTPQNGNPCDCRLDNIIIATKRTLKSDASRMKDKKLSHEIRKAIIKKWLETDRHGRRLYSLDLLGRIFNIHKSSVSRVVNHVPMRYTKRPRKLTHSTSPRYVQAQEILKEKPETRTMDLAIMLDCSISQASHIKMQIQEVELITNYGKT